MNKKVWSIILLCLIALSLVLTAVLCAETGISIYKIKNNEIDLSDNSLPGAPIISVLAYLVSAWGGFLLLEFVVASVGFISALINQKIAINTVVRRISTVFLCLYSAILLLIIGILISFAIRII